MKIENETILKSSKFSLDYCKIMHNMLLITFLNDLINNLIDLYKKEKEKYSIYFKILKNLIER